MRYFLDTEFNGFGGELLSMAIVREDGNSLYLRYAATAPIEPWVAENVMPIMEAQSVPTLAVTQKEGAHAIAAFLTGDAEPQIITDWPDDVKYLCQAVITGPGEMAAIAGFTCRVVRVAAYPTTLPGAVQHNAWWDAMALRHLYFNGRKDAA